MEDLQKCHEKGIIKLTIVDILTVLDSHKENGDWTRFTEIVPSDDNEIPHKDMGLKQTDEYEAISLLFDLN